MTLGIRIGALDLGKPQGEASRLFNLFLLVGRIAGHSPGCDGAPDRHEGRLLPAIAGEPLGWNQARLIRDGAVVVIGPATQPEQGQTNDRSRWSHEAGI